MKVILKQPTAKVSEVFLSVQGEGIYAGESHIFVRFHGCNMNCVFCDTPQHEVPETSSLRSVVDRILDFAKDRKVNDIYLTGGEPLLHSDFLKVLLPHLKEKGHKIHLDTNGSLPDRLKQVINLVDIIAMDIKLPSSTRDKEWWDEHLEFLKIAKEKTVFIKMVITNDTHEADINRAVELIRCVDKNIPLILQPASQFGDFKSVPDNAKLIEWQGNAQEKLADVRIIPQLHKIKGVK